MKPFSAARASVAVSPFTSGITTLAPDPVVRVPTHPTSGSVAWWIVFFGLCLILLAPLAITDVPPLLDYPNHLARLFVLAFGPTDPVLASFYAPQWGIIPNLALDATVPPLLRVMPVHLAGRFVVGLILLLPLLGAIAYHRALSGRMSYWPLAAVLFAYNLALLKGFLNFIAAVGIALLFAAAWVTWRERRPAQAVLVAIIGAVALFFCHLIGLLFYAILIGAHELASLRSEAHWLRSGVRRCGSLIIVFAAPVALYAMSHLNDMTGAAEFRSLADKARTAVTPVINYYWPLDLATAALCIVAVACCLWRRWCVIPLQASLAITALVLLFLVLPHAYKGTFDLDTRFVIAAAAMAPAAMIPVKMPRRAALVLGVGFLLLFCARMGVVMETWYAWRAELAGFRAVISPVRPGDAVLTIRLPREREPSVWNYHAHPRRLSDGTLVDAHTTALLVIEHRAWWPFLFDNPSQQPIRSQEPFNTLSERIEESTDPLSLLISDEPEMQPVTHVLVLGVGRTATDGLEPVTRNGNAALYRVPHKPR